MLQKVHKNWWALHKVQNLKEDERVYVANVVEHFL